MIYQRRMNPYFARGWEREPGVLRIYTAKWIREWLWTEKTPDHIRQQQYHSFSA